MPSADDEISVRSLPVDTFANAVDGMRERGMTVEQWWVLVDAGVIPAGYENAYVEFSEDPEAGSWTVRARWIEFPDA